LTQYGWVATWDSTTVPDGTYTLTDAAYDSAGNYGISQRLTVTVENTPPPSWINAPSNGASVSGNVLLAGGAPGDVGVTAVQFELTGGSLNHVLIATGGLGSYGWLAGWNSTTVPDGTYTLNTLATDQAGFQGLGPGVTIIVENNPPSTAVVVPSNGASVSGSQVVLDATAPPNVGVTGVQYALTGGSLNNAVIATASPTYYGWIATWNSTTVPNGTYTLESEAADGAGLQGVSPPVSVTVSN
jgi:major membrane immunogen (membrane-anchored lipoprotein)